MVDINKVALQLVDIGNDAARGFPFEVQPIPGEQEVLQIIIEDREELPIFISATEEQILCIAYLFKEDEIEDGMLAEVNNSMLLSNISMPLSSFAKLDSQYVIYGALSVNSSLEDIVHEIEVLSGNTTEAIEAISEFLN
ncbi:MAG: DUF2170 family protein [Thermodesulfobacteriota bacterium]